MRPEAARRDDAVHWHDAECGAYGADLPLWEELAAGTAGPVLDLGCGTGRVALHLARRRHEVTGVDVSEAFVEALGERADGRPVRALAADVRELDLGHRFGLVLAPMQLVQLLEPPARRDFLFRLPAHLAPGATVAIAIVEGPPVGVAGPGALPDIREVDGWVYSSLPLESVDEGEAILVRRLRQLLAPSGEISEEVDEIRLFALDANLLEAEARGAGLEPLGRREIPATPDHVGSTVVLLGGEG